MAIPALANADIKTDEALDEAVMKDGLRDRADWLHADATGSGINPNVLEFVAKMLSHGHTGAAGDGANIPTAGIAAGAVNDSGMMATNSVTAAKIATKTMDTAEFATGAVTEPKMHNSMGEHLTGASAFDIGAAPLTGDVVFRGDRKSINHSKGAARGVVTSILVGNIAGVDIPYWVVSVSNSAVTFGLRNNGTLPAGLNSWVIDAWFM